MLLRNIRATLFIDGEAIREEFGEIGFSERGIEGAVALRMSRDAVDALIDGRRVKLSLDLKPALTVEILQERIRREIAEMPEEEFFAELLRKLLPKPLVMPVCKELDIQSKTYVKKIGNKEIDRLISLLKGFVLPISDYAPFEYAVVTAGGRPLRRSEPLHDGIAQSQGSLFCRRGARSGRQHRRLQPPDCILDRTAGRTAQTMKLAVRYRFRRNAERLRSHLARARFFRGHGVHSPFVYAIVRQVFMKTELREGDRSLYAALRERGVNERRAVPVAEPLYPLRIQPVRHEPCNRSRSVHRNRRHADRPAAAAGGGRRREGATLCIMEPYADVERRNCCRRLAAEHPSTSIDNRGYLLLFNGTLPKQHFKL